MNSAHAMTTCVVSLSLLIYIAYLFWSDRDKETAVKITEDAWIKGEPGVGVWLCRTSNGSYSVFEIREHDGKRQWRTRADTYPHWNDRWYDTAKPCINYHIPFTPPAGIKPSVWRHAQLNTEPPEEGFACVSMRDPTEIIFASQSSTQIINDPDAITYLDNPKDQK